MMAATEYHFGNETIRVPDPVPFAGSAKHHRNTPVFNVNAAVRDHLGDATMIFVAEDWLPVNCWCEAEIVGVPQYEVVELLTRSCGRPWCVNPETNEQVIGNAVTNSATTVRPELCVDAPAARVIEWGAGQSINNRGGRNPERQRRRAYPAPSRVREHHRQVERMPKEDVEIRRDLVEMLWREGKSHPNIALELQIPPHTVDNDVQWLRVKGRI